MTKDFFLDLMKNWGVTPSAYSIDGEEKDDSLNIKKIAANCYLIYYLERGKIVEFERVNSLEEAYDEIAGEIKHWIDTGSSVSPVSKEFIENYEKIIKQRVKERKLKKS